MTEYNPVPRIAQELSLPEPSVSATVKLLAEGATVPFIARYRKEVTGGLDEVQIRNIEERRGYLLELEERRQTVLSEIERQGKLTDELRKKILTCQSKTDLEDLYLPYKPKRRTRAIIARERGLEPLADKIWSQALSGSPETEAQRFIDASKEVPDLAAALAGARDICAERIAEDAEARKLLRGEFNKEGSLQVQKEKEHDGKVTKFDTYASYEEKIATMPSHRFLAIRRGEAEGVLRSNLELSNEPDVLVAIQKAAKVNNNSPWAAELTRASNDAYRRLLSPSVQSDLRIDLKLAADRAAVDVFAQNLRELLMAAPFGTQSVIGIDPGQRTGCKVVVVDETGKLLHHTLIHLVQGEGALQRAREILRDLCRKYQPRAIAVGNGTHGRETEDFAREVLAAEGLKETLCLAVSEAGASVYSASDIARDEFPDLDLTVRGAISIARRLQDPLAELVKIDPKSIGVGQYQHDVHQPLLAKKLDDVVESCVNQVGVEVNTASAPLLARVAGIGPSLARKIVAYRNDNGIFKNRKMLLDVPGMGPKTFEQAAGFLRVRGGEHPLDASAVHPERYSLVERMASDLGIPVASIIGDLKTIERIDFRKYMSADVGEFTLKDILAELKKPGRDPRATFEPPKFRDDVRTMEDLKPGMELEGVVTNVTAFGAFVDIGVHQDGLIHVSQLADRFIKDPAEVVKVGDKLKVKVLEIDLQRKRISLTARKGERPQATGSTTGTARPLDKDRRGNQPQSTPHRNDAPRIPPQQGKFSNNPFAKLAEQNKNRR